MPALCLFLVLGLAVARAAEPTPVAADAAAARPNVIVILADDLGWGDLGCQEPLDDAGPEAVVRTPRIDALAAAGARFTSGYANHMVCSPTRAALLSGGPQQRLGFYGFPETMAAFPAVPLLPEPFRAAGYATGMVGKWHVSFLPGSRPLDRGFERFFGFLGGEHDYFLPNVGQATHGIAGSTDAFVFDQEKPAPEIGYLTDEFTTRAIGFIDEARAAAKPFLLYLAYNAPHTPLQVPWDSLEPFARAKGGRFDSRDIARAMIERLDANVGRLLDHLRGAGIDRDTLVIFTSDNGAAQPGYTGGLRGRKGQFYEGGIRVPLIATWPARIPAGQVCHTPVITHDIFPTALAAAGIAEVPETVTGLDWLPHLAGDKRPWPARSLHWSSAGKKARWAVRAGRWKLVNDDTRPGIGAWPLAESPAASRGKPAVKVQLYDLEADPAERHDLGAAEPDVVARLRADIDGFLAGLPPSLATAEVIDRSKAIQREREADPARYPTAPRRDGAPGHWKEAAQAEAAGREPPGITTPRVESFPREGRGYRLIDWRRRTEDFLDAVLDPVRQGEYLPLMWWDDTRIHWPHTTFGLPSYVGMKGQWGVHRNAHEAIVTMSTVLSGALVDRDMTRYPVPASPAPVNLVAMQEAYFSPDDGVFLDGIGSRSGGSFWYELFPSILAGALVAEHPDEAPLAEAWRRSCRRWAEAGLHLWQLNDYDFQAYDLRTKQGVVKGWREPDAAAGLAFLMQMAAAKWPDEASFRHETRHALDWLCRQDRNLNYEIFTAFGVYAAARCNAEQGTAYDVGKLFGWCFEDSAVRGMSPHWPDVAQGDGYGVVSGRWGDDDVAGLVGVTRGGLSTPTMRGGYAFAMETFAYGWPLVAATRYDNRLARAVGKWMHAAAHSARLFYPDQVPPDRQSDWAWAEKHTTAIPYEGIMERNNRTGSPGPFASGDPTNQGWGPLNIGIYSGGLSGVFGGIVRATNVPGVLALDTTRMDYFSTTVPTTLLYNPGSEPAAVRLPTGREPVRAWEAVGNAWLAAEPVTGELTVTVPPDAAVLVALVPAELEPRFAHGRLVAGEAVVDFSAPAPAADASAAAPAAEAAEPRVAAPANGSETARRPNVLVVFTDDHGWADLAAQGVDEHIRTPQIDALAAAGVRFSRGYVTAPQCVPSRAGLLTGIHQNRFGVEDNQKGPLPHAVVTLPERLRELGYVTGMSGKWHLDVSHARASAGEAKADPAFLPHRHGFDEYWSGAMQRYDASHALDGTPFPDAPRTVSDRRFRIEVQTEAALGFLDRRRAEPDRPWFLYVPYFGPHVPLESPEPWFSRTPEHLPLERRQALAIIAAIDAGVGRLRDKIRELGQEQDTLVFVIGDNGAPLKAGGWDGSLNLPLVGEKGMLTDGGVRVPFVAAWPGTLPAGLVYDEPVSSLDVAATALVAAGGDLAAAKQPRPAASDDLAALPLEGVDLVPFLAGREAGGPHERLFWRWRSQAAVLEHPWKLVRLGRDTTYLFDVTTPAGELVNRAAEQPALTARLTQALDEWTATLAPPGPERPLNGQDAQFFAEHVERVPDASAAKRPRREKARQP